MPAKSKTKRTTWLLDTDNAEFAADRAMERILRRDGEHET
jgi:hypothetical protein